MRVACFVVGESIQSSFTHALAYIGSGKASPDQIAGRYFGGSGKGAGEPSGLRVSFFLESTSTTRIRFAGQQKLRKTLRAPERVAGFDYLQQRGRFEFERAMTVPVIAGDHQCEVAGRGRYRKALAKGSNEIDAAPLVTNMLWQFINRRRRFAEIVHKCREAHG